MLDNRPRTAPGLAITALAASGTLTSLQFTLVVPALPAIAAALSVPMSDAAWFVTVTLLTGAIGTPILTRMADMYGRKRLLLISLGLLIVGSVIAAVGMSFATVLLGRALQGVATAIVPIGISLLRDQVSAERASSAVALMGATMGIGSVIGLVLSGVLLQAFGVPALFWFSAIAGIVFLVGIMLTVNEPPAHSGGKFDLLGALVLAVGLGAILLVISKGVQWGWASAGVLALAALGIATLALWVPLQLRHPRPVIDLRASFRAPILQINVASFFASTGMFGNHLLTVQEVQAPPGTGAGLGLSPLSAGLTMVPAAIAIVALSPVTGHLLNRFGGRPMLAAGSAIMSLAFAYRLVTHDSLATVVIGAACVGVGTALSFAAMPTLILAAAPLRDASSAVGINSLVRTLAGAVTSAIFALLISAFAVDAHGAQFLSETGITIAFAALAGCCGIAAVLALLLPRARLEAADAAAQRV